jgi:GTP cyclohydrolase I
MIENKRRKKVNIEELETAQFGYANGISTQLQKLIETGEHRSLTQQEKQEMVKEAAEHYGKFLTALGCDWQNDPNSMETPWRVAKAYVNDLWKGRYELPSDITAFPSDGYRGIILEKDISVVSQCSHHHQTILGKAHVAYIPGEEGKVIGLSKINRIVEHFARRGAIQEQLTVAIHNAMDKICEGNVGVMVVIQATHNCVACRGVKHMGASMITSEVSGVFADHTKTAKQEVLGYIKMNLETYK